MSTCGLLFQRDRTINCLTQLYIILLLLHKVHSAKEFVQRLVVRSRRYNVSEWSQMSTYGFLFQWDCTLNCLAQTIFI